MQDVIYTERYEFPYTDLRFPGMNTGERILFVTRESPLVHKLRLGGLALVVGVLLVTGTMFIMFGGRFVSQLLVLQLPLFALAGAIFLIGWWWISTTYKKSVFIITTRRLTKIIHTTPINWYQFSLGLDEIEDTGSYASSFFEALFGLGYFVARSGAGAIKNFKIVNITFSRDLHNYVNKLLYAFKHHPAKINEFRPFVPHLKGGDRSELAKKYPQYRTEFD